MKITVISFLLAIYPQGQPLSMTWHERQVFDSEYYLTFVNPHKEKHE